MELPPHPPPQPPQHHRHRHQQQAYAAANVAAEQCIRQVASFQTPRPFQPALQLAEAWCSHGAPSVVHLGAVCGSDGGRGGLSWLQLGGWSGTGVCGVDVVAPAGSQRSCGPCAEGYG